jgi:hypothetical protein
MGNNYDPITLHKYLYANADPGNMIDPSGNFSMGSMMSAINVMGRLSTIATNTYDVFQIATGEKEFSAREIGTNLLLSRLPVKFVAKLFRKGCNFNSFEGDTLVSTESGLVEIKDIKIGDKIWAYDEETRKNSLQEVVHIITGSGNNVLVDISLDSGDTITATDEHPFYILTRGAWVDAVDLEVGEVLKDLFGNAVVITKIRIYRQETTVYNLTVNEHHTFYVGDDSVLSHNQNACLKALEAATRKVKRIQQRPIKRGSRYHGRIPQDLEDDIIKTPDGVYLSEGSSGRLIFHKGGDVVIVESKGSSVGNIITSYGPSGPRGSSGAAALGGLAADPGEAITAAKIIAGDIPMPGGGTLPAAVLLNVR